MSVFISRICKICFLSVFQSLLTNWSGADEIWAHDSVIAAKTSAGIINWNTLAGTKQIEKNVECISLLKQNAKNVKTSTPKILEICSAIGWRRPHLLSYSFIAANVHWFKRLKTQSVPHADTDTIIVSDQIKINV